ncbi:peptidoglycan -binding protein, partial [Paracoccus binzhouensis]|uniref:peptidoglycan -binding protein n=1 Tax=Paracoccus binzhouensis TaxID=2796149 RepID=UPI0018EEEE03
SEQAVAGARAEIDAQTEAARLAAARREALEALIGDLRRRNAETQQQLDETEAARLTDAAAAEALRERLAKSDAELDAATLELEAARKQAEETLTLLAAAEAAKKELGTQAEAQASEAEKQAGLLALAQQKLSEQEALSAEDRRRVALLNRQVAQLNDQLGSLRAVLDAAGDERRAADLRAEDLGRQLNVALLRAAEEERKRRALEAEARARAEAEAKDLARYRSEFFGRLSQILAGREGVRVVGDRFVFSSEVLFPTGEATLSPEGRAQIARVTERLQQISAEIPPEIDWMIRVDGHTDNQPLSGQGRYRDNWELSQARALAVVRYMVDELGFPEARLAPTGFADTRPVAPGDTPEARAQNRRIELKLTER